VRKEGYTDFKGSFEIQLGQDAASRDATESGRDVFQNSGNRGPTQGMDSDFGISNPNASRSPDVTHPELLGCELRASLPGFISSAVPLRVDGSSWDLNVGTIVLKRMENVEGTTISLTSMSAPSEAKHAYEKAEKAVAARKYPDAEKELSKAVKAYPEYAAAWAMLGEIHRNQNQLDSAREEYNRAIAADPQFVNPYYGLAILSVHQKNWEDVLKYTSQVARLNPAAFPLIFMYNGAANFYLGHLDAAEESARRFKRLDSGHQHPDSALLLSNILAARRDYEGAAQQLQEYLALVPNAPNAMEVKNQLEQLRSLNAAKKP
jgi:TolA-binding protein